MLFTMGVIHIWQRKLSRRGSCCDTVGAGDGDDKLHLHTLQKRDTSQQHACYTLQIATMIWCDQYSAPEQGVDDLPLLVYIDIYKLVKCQVLKVRLTARQGSIICMRLWRELHSGQAWRINDVRTGLNKWCCGTWDCQLCPFCWVCLWVGCHFSSLVFFWGLISVAAVILVDKEKCNVLGATPTPIVRLAGVG